MEPRTRLGLAIDDILEVMRRGVRADISRALHRCPESVDGHIYDLRNRIERCITHLKNARRVATR